MYEEQRTAWQRTEEEMKQQHAQENTEATETIAKLEIEWRDEKTQWEQQEALLKDEYVVPSREPIALVLT